MTFPEVKWLSAVMRTACTLWFLVFLIVPAPLSADDGDIEVWLLTYGPGEIYWQRFGHNAIWIRDPAVGLDHTFNFGFFDFEQEGFLWNFVQGRLNYFAAARPARVEIEEYIHFDRSVRAQKLDIDPANARALRDYLLDQVSRENREYLYDYYRHNCSTRIRDAIDLAVGGALHSHLGDAVADQDYRDHTRRLTAMDPLYYLGLQAGLASPVDRIISRWDEAFIPGVLADAVSDFENPQTGRPLVMEDTVLHASALPPPAPRAAAVWHRYLVTALVIVFLAWTVSRFTPLTGRQLALSWLGLAGLLGAVLVFLWVFTDHWVTALNLNLLLLNPLWWMVMIPALRKPVAWLVALCCILAFAGPMLPPGQYTADVVALVLPLNLVAAWVLLRSVSQLGE